MANKIELPKDPQLASKIVETEHAARIAEMGSIGRWFGTRDNAVIYLAFVIILIAVIGSVYIGDV